MSSDNSKCQDIMDQFLMLDKHERVPLKVSLHLIKCKECRSKVRMLTQAEKLSAASLKNISPVTSDELMDVIDNVNPFWRNMIKPVSLSKWVICGILMIVLFVIFGLFIRHMDIQRFYVWFYLIFGCSVSLYCAFFVGVNMDFFIKQIDTVKLFGVYDKI